MALLIKNGEIVTASERYVADIYCEGETISQIAPDIAPPADPAVRVIDARGKYVFPGFIDPHTHIYLPFMGTFAKDTYETASRAALIGGTTTIFDMCCPARDTDAAEGLRVWREQSEGRSACDHALHMGVTRFDEANERQLREIVRSGVASFKVFLAYKGAFGIDDTELYRTLKLARELGVIVAAHCENETLVAERQAELLAAGLRGPASHHESRPPIVEAEGVHHLMTFAQLTGAHVYIVHLSCEEALQEAVAARLRGVNVRVETLIQYLLLDASAAERGDFEGAKYVMSPPLRDKRHQAVLWNGLRSGLIDTVATDHAPFDFQSQKTLGPGRFHEDSQRHPGSGRPRELAVDPRRPDRPPRPAHVRAGGQHQRGADLRAVPAQGHNPDRRGRGPRRLRSGLSRDNFRPDPGHEPGLQRVRRLGDRRPPEPGHGARTDRRGRGPVCR